MTNEQQFKQDLLSIIRYSAELLQNLENNFLKIHISDVNKTGTIANQLYNMTIDLIADIEDLPY